MPITLKCPECHGLISVPKKYLGQTINCPRNGCVIEIRAGDGSSSGDARRSDLSDPIASGTAAAPPALRVSPAGLNGSSAHAASEKSLARPVTAADESQWLKRNSARFISAEKAVASTQLAADGRLPELSLSEGGDRRAAGDARGTNPLVMIGVLCLSFVMSTMLVFVDFEPPESASRLKADARRQLVEFYREPGPALKPYQEHLRDAQRAHSRGDLETEREMYRRVLNLLHAEGRSPYARLTHDDKELEDLLSVLLMEE